ncbi:hypothetical protein [Mucilaginibacter sp.]|uniref:hypothetical protein n=1 Tax=Mucilaginibacter sp. TaxID=1882438 RepID=UPI002ED4FA61
MGNNSMRYQTLAIVFCIIVSLILPYNRVSAQMKIDSNSSNIWNVLNVGKIDSLTRSKQITLKWKNVVDHKFDSVYFTGKALKFKTTYQILDKLKDTIKDNRQQELIQSYLKMQAKVDSLSNKNDKFETRFAEWNSKIVEANSNTRTTAATYCYLANANADFMSFRQGLVDSDGKKGKKLEELINYIDTSSYTLQLAVDNRYLQQQAFDIFITEDIGTATAGQIASNFGVIPGRVKNYSNYEKESKVLREYFKQNLGLYTYEYALPAFQNDTHSCRVSNLQKNFQWAAFIFQDKYLYAYWPLNGIIKEFRIPY